MRISDWSSDVCSSDLAVFLGRTNQPITRFGIHRVVTQCAERVSESLATMKDKRISPHTIRHTTAVHLLRAGVDINTIRAWLGHVSLDTTHIYAEVRSEEHTSELQSLMRISYAVFCLKTKNKDKIQ